VAASFKVACHDRLAIAIWIDRAARPFLRAARRSAGDDSAKQDQNGQDFRHLRASIASETAMLDARFRGASLRDAKKKRRGYSAATCFFGRTSAM
jgi:hypothetical protein